MLQQVAARFHATRMIMMLVVLRNHHCMPAMAPSVLVPTVSTAWRLLNTHLVIWVCRGAIITGNARFAKASKAARTRETNLGMQSSQRCCSTLPFGNFPPRPAQIFGLLDGGLVDPNVLEVASGVCEKSASQPQSTRSTKSNNNRHVDSPPRQARVFFFFCFAPGCCSMEPPAPAAIEHAHDLRRDHLGAQGGARGPLVHLFRHPRGTTMQWFPMVRLRHWSG